MAADAISVFAKALSAALMWFEDILSAAGLNGLYLAVIFLLLLSKFLLKPIFGSVAAGSDTARKSKGDENE